MLLLLSTPGRWTVLPESVEAGARSVEESPRPVDPPAFGRPDDATFQRFEQRELRLRGNETHAPREEAGGRQLSPGETGLNDGRQPDARGNGFAVADFGETRERSVRQFSMSVAP